MHVTVPADGVHHVLFTADSQRLVSICSGKEGKRAQINRVATGRREAVVPLGGHDGAEHRPRTFLLSPDGKSMAYASPKEGRGQHSDECQVAIWDLVNSRQRTVFQESVRVPVVLPMSFSPDGRLLACGIINKGWRLPAEVKVWDVNSGRVTHTFPVPPVKSQLNKSEGLHEGVRVLSFTPDGRRIIGMVVSNISGYESHFLCWDLANETLPKSLTKSHNELRFFDLCSIDFEFTSESSQVLLRNQTFIGGNIAHLFDFSGNEPRLLESFAESLIITHDGTKLALNNQAIGLFFVFTKSIMSASGQDSVKESRKLQLLDLATRQRRDLLQPFWGDGWLIPLAFSPDDRVVVVLDKEFYPNNRWYQPLLTMFRGPERPVHLYDVGSGTRLARLPGDLVLFSPDAKALFTLSVHFIDKVATLRVYEYPLRSPVLTILGYAVVFTAIPFLLLWTCRVWRQRKRAK